jgi:hypothetical protein
VRAYRQRQRAGLAVFRVTALEYDLVQAMIEAERLSVADALDRRRVEHALAALVAEWSARWLREKV